MVDNVIIISLILSQKLVDQMVFSTNFLPTQCVQETMCTFVITLCLLSTSLTLLPT